MCEQKVKDLLTGICQASSERRALDYGTSDYQVEPTGSNFFAAVKKCWCEFRQHWKLYVNCEKLFWINTSVTTHGVFFSLCVSTHQMVLVTFFPMMVDISTWKLFLKILFANFQPKITFLLLAKELGLSTKFYDVTENFLRELIIGTEWTPFQSRMISYGVIWKTHSDISLLVTVKVHLHQASVSTLRQLSKDASNTVLIEKQSSRSRIGLHSIFKWHCCL